MLFFTFLLYEYALSQMAKFYNILTEWSIKTSYMYAI